MRATAVVLSSTVAAVNEYIRITDKRNHSQWTLELVPVTERFRPRGGSPIYGRSSCLQAGLLTISMESLILAQDERWRRA